MKNTDFSSYIINGNQLKLHAEGYTNILEKYLIENPSITTVDLLSKILFRKYSD